MVLKDSVPILYRSKDCGRTANWNVTLLTYESATTINGETFTDLGGYYAVWERCCRNGNILNIQEPGKAGATYYLYFPPLHEAINSSPRFKPVVGDFLCANKPMQLDFGASDPDGDSLAYRLVTPVIGSSNDVTNISPYPSSSPWQKALWLAPFDSVHVTLGEVPLSIDAQTGLVSLNSSFRGLFLFAIECTEYRAGQPIGKVYRDYQLNITPCPTNEKPQVRALIHHDSLDQANVMVPYGKKTCFSLLVQDKEVNSSYTFALQNPSSTGSFASNTIRSSATDSTAMGMFCLLPCTPSAAASYTIVVRDNGCPVRYDTLLLEASVAPASIPAIKVLPDVRELELATFDTSSFRVTAQSDSLLADLSLTSSQEGNTGRVLRYQANAVSATESRILLQPTCEALEKGWYSLEFQTKAKGCNVYYGTKTEVRVHVVDKQQKVHLPSIPNVFTPNGDGVNDTFAVRYFLQESCGKEFRNLKIFNRWGSTVYRSDQLNDHWDALLVPDGLYFYEAEYEEGGVKGIVQVIR